MPGREGTSCPGAAARAGRGRARAPTGLWERCPCLETSCDLSGQRRLCLAHGRTPLSLVKRPDETRTGSGLRRRKDKPGTAWRPDAPCCQKRASAPAGLSCPSLLGRPSSGCSHPHGGLCAAAGRARPGGRGARAPEGAPARAERLWEPSDGHRCDLLTAVRTAPASTPGCPPGRQRRPLQEELGARSFSFTETTLTQERGPRATPQPIPGHGPRGPPHFSSSLSSGLTRSPS